MQKCAFACVRMCDSLLSLRENEKKRLARGPEGGGIDCHGRRREKRTV